MFKDLQNIILDELITLIKNILICYCNDYHVWLCICVQKKKTKKEQGMFSGKKAKAISTPNAPPLNRIPLPVLLVRKYVYDIIVISSHTERVQCGEY